MCSNLKNLTLTTPNPSDYFAAIADYGFQALVFHKQDKIGL